jgi:hypothetical protein
MMRLRRVPLVLDLFFVVAALGTVPSSVARGDLLVAGVAVYHDEKDGREYRAAATELILVGGRYDGKQPAVPHPELDRDVTASRNNGYRAEDEGIFHLASNEPVEPVSIFYSLRNLDPTKDPPGSPRFFSKSFDPRILGKNGRRSVKVWLELWPTDRTIREVRELRGVVSGIIRARALAQPRPEEMRTPRQLMLEEFRIVSALLPREAEPRNKLVFQTWDALPAALPPALKDQVSDLKEDALLILREPNMKLFEQESQHWARVREAR